jgi:hypothetical protein
MKVILAIGLLAVAGCTNNPEKTELMSMPGAYNMLSQTTNDGKKDTTFTTLKQLKIYTDTHMMYVQTNPADSVSAFGIGTYTAKGDTVTENIIYNASDTSANPNPQSFTLIITKTDKGYKQVIPEIQTRNGRKTKLTEEYETSGNDIKSALDGAWKETKAYTIKGKDSVANKTIQYKTYFHGHFIFGHTYLDSNNIVHTGMGYGIFEMPATNKVNEHVLASTYSQLRGKSFDIDIEMNGTDEFKQTITNDDGTKSVEIYQRLKK